MSESENGADGAQATLEQIRTLEEGVSELRVVLGTLAPQALPGSSPVTELVREDYHEAFDGDHSVFYVSTGGTRPQRMVVDVVNSGGTKALKTLYLGTPDGGYSTISPDRNGANTFDTKFFPPTEKARTRLLNIMDVKLDLGKLGNRQVYRPAAAHAA